MKKLTADEMLGRHPEPCDDASSGIRTVNHPRQCPNCGKNYEIRKPLLTGEPIERLETCPECLIKDCPGLAHRPADALTSVDDLPDMLVAEDYWQD